MNLIPINSFNIQNAFFLAKCSSIIYGNKTSVENTLSLLGYKVAFYDLCKYDNQFFIAYDDKDIIIAFRGTEPKKISDWLSDSAIIMKDHRVIGKVHHGFYDIIQECYPIVEAEIKSIDKGRNVWITGHSLGGALAVLMASELLCLNQPIEGIYLYGCPRVGDSIFKYYYNKHFGDKTFRVINGSDVVPRLPRPFIGYRTIGTTIYIDNKENRIKELSWCEREIDRIWGFWDSLKKLRIDELDDHFIANYLKNIEKNLNE
jgi:triacylglycerol lipase